MNLVWNVRYFYIDLDCLCKSGFSTHHLGVLGGVHTRPRSQFWDGTKLVGVRTSWFFKTFADSPLCSGAAMGATDSRICVFSRYWPCQISFNTWQRTHCLWFGASKRPCGALSRYGSPPSSGGGHEIHIMDSRKYICGSTNERDLFVSLIGRNIFELFVYKK